MTEKAVDDLRQAVALNLMRWRMEDEAGDWPADKVAAVLSEIDKPHSGDCTNMPWSCLRCAAEAVYRQTDELVEVITKSS